MTPSRTSFAAAAVVTLIALAASFSGIVLAALPWIAALILIAAAVDAAMCLRIPTPPIERKLPRSLSLMTWIDVRLTLTNADVPRPIRLRLFDHCPESFERRGLPLDVSIPPGRSVDVAYAIRPTERGMFELPGLEIRIASPFGFWSRRRFVPLATSVRVYPNYSTISSLLAFEVDSRLQLAGMRLRQRRGEGTEFHQLRDYRESDSIRSIDWKATARSGRLIAREYQDERDQQVVFLVDAGRRMLARDGELSHFDHALNAMLLLSYIALRRGDSVGILTAGEDRRWLAPRKGADAITTLLNHVYDVQPVAQETDLVAAATDLAMRQRRRALVVVLTNLRDERSDDLGAATSLLRRHHLVMVASLREAAIDDTLAHRVSSFDDAILYAGAERYLEARRASHDLLRGRGIFIDDCLCTELPMTITNRYLAIKRAGLL